MLAQPLLIPISVLLIRLAAFRSAAAASGEDAFNFTFPGFAAAGADLALTQLATVTPEGLLRLTNDTKQDRGHAFYRTPLRLRADGTNRSLSFSTSFVFAIRPEYPDVSGHGIVFLIAPTVDLAGTVASQHLGLPGDMNNSSHIVAVEFDIVKNEEFGDIDDNHVGIDINSVRSRKSATVSYIDESGVPKNLSLRSGNPLRAWIDYDGRTTRLEVTVSPAGQVSKPAIPVLSYAADLSSIVTDKAYVGFSASTGAATATQYVLGWSFRLEGKADELDISKLPPLPPIERPGQSNQQRAATYSAAAVGALLIFLLAIATAVYVVRKKRQFAEVLEDWEEEYGPHRFSYKELFKATRGFGQEQLVGAGGFGRVYQGFLAASKTEIAVKKVSHDTEQGMPEFVSEVASMGRLRHRNLVPLLGYCRRRGELLLVYEFMPNGSLDKFLFGSGESRLGWEQRFHIVKGVAAGLLYLHDGWEQVVVHRDIKSGNVLLDADMSGRLSDFGLARLYDRGSNPHTTRVVGTLGYMAPELCKTGKATTATDVYAFGAFLLEVTCGRRPMEMHSSSDEPFLVDWVLHCWKGGNILDAADPVLRRGGDGGKANRTEEVELVLVLGLLCSHPEAGARPSMRQVLRYLEWDAPLPAFSPDRLEASYRALGRNEGFDDYVVSGSYASSSSYTTHAVDFPTISDPFFSRSH